MPHAWLRPPNAAAPDKLAIAEKLRTTHHIEGAVSDFRVDDSQLFVSSKVQATPLTLSSTAIHETYELLETRSGFVAVLNDFNKGRDTGHTWSLLIDFAAIKLTLMETLRIGPALRRATNAKHPASSWFCRSSPLPWLIYLRFVP